jgi:hypothetical protein
VARRRGLGVDPLDALTTDAPSVGEVGPVGSVARTNRTAPKRRDEPVKLGGDVMDEARAAVNWLRYHGEPDTTLKALIERAVRTEVQRLADERNGGEAFPSAGPLPRGGRIQPR